MTTQEARFIKLRLQDSGTYPPSLEQIKRVVGAAIDLNIVQRTGQ